MLASGAGWVTSLSITRQNRLWFAFHEPREFHNSQGAQGTVRTSNNSWSLKILKGGGGSLDVRSDWFCSLPTPQPLPSTTASVTAAVLAGVTFLLCGAHMWHWHHRETRVDLGLSLALLSGGIQGKVKPGPLLRVTQPTRRTLLCTCTLLSRLQNALTHIPLSFHSLLYDQVGKQGSHREHEVKATTPAFEFSVLPMPCLRHTAGQSPEAVQSDHRTCL